MWLQKGCTNGQKAHEKMLVGHWENENQKHSELALHTHRHGIIKMPRDSFSNCSKDVERLEHCILLVEIYNSLAAVENSLAISLKVRVIVWPSNATPRYTPKRNENTHPHKNLCMDVPCSVAHNSLKVGIAQHPSTDVWVKKVCYIHPKEYYLAVINVMPDVRIPKREDRRPPRQCNSQKGKFIADSSQGSCRIQHSGAGSESPEPKLLHKFIGWAHTTGSWFKRVGYKFAKQFHWSKLWRDFPGGFRPVPNFLIGKQWSVLSKSWLVISRWSDNLTTQR